MKRIHGPGGIRAPGGDHVADPLGAIGADQADLGAAFLTQDIEERLDGLAVPTGFGPHQVASVVVHHDHEVLGPFL